MTVAELDPVMEQGEEGFEVPYYVALTTYLSYGVLFIIGSIRDIYRRSVGKLFSRKKLHEGYAPLCKDFEDFYTRRLYHRIQDCFNRPIASAPTSWIDVVERVSYDSNKTLHQTENTIRCLNLGSYNYLGFASHDEYCTPRVLESMNKYGASACATRLDSGTTVLHNELEVLVAKYIGKPAAMVYGMGYATNSTSLPVLVGKGGLIVSDALNHASIVNGSRGSGAKIKVFQHNSASHLEQVLREAISQGQPRTHRPWKKILVVIEGIYSMEGELCRLKEIVAVAKKYKTYIYLDEAHSIGAIGKTGKGICELQGVDPADIDVMMGTFTKSFGSCGGYIAGSEDLIKYMKYSSPAHMYATSMSAPAVQQVISALEVILGLDGSKRGAKKLAQVRENSNYVRTELRNRGFEVLGDTDSPVMPVMLYNPGKIPAFSRECLKRNVAVVVVAFPATPLLLARTRICISASHTREDLDKAVKVISEVGEMCNIKYFPSKLVEDEKYFWYDQKKLQ